MSAKVLEVRDLEVTIETPAGVLTAIDRASFDLRKGEILGLVGESGSGKTLTGRAIMRLLPSKKMAIRSGTILVNGEDITREEDAQYVPALERLAQRLGMTYVFGPCLRWPAQNDMPAGAYGNAILSRWPILAGAGHHLTAVEGKEQRGLHLQ